MYRFMHSFRWMAVILLSACSTAPVSNSNIVIAETYTTIREEAMNIDSVSTWVPGTGEPWLLATAKEGHLIRIFNANTGDFLRDFGGPGNGAGEFLRPNGILVIDDLLFVVERDNRRVQVFSLPALDSVAHFGTDRLVNPYGLYVLRTDSGTYRIFVTDNYETPDEQVPPDEELDRRVQVWDVESGPASGRSSTVNVSHVMAFGETQGDGILRVVESIWGDPEYDRLLIAEELEDETQGRVLKAYGQDGRFRGETVGAGVFAAQAEGIMLRDCGDGAGYWIATDQSYGANVFHLFDRASLELVASFQGRMTLNTDGIWMMEESTARFPNGALFAVHDDQAVSAFDWRDIVENLGLRQSCL